MLREIFFGKQKLLRETISLHIALILISFVFVYIFSYSTSFRYDFFGGDSVVFQTVGNFWAQGYLPYKDIFDHKGIIVYCANALGYMIYPRIGVMVSQIICLYLSCLFVWRAMELYSSCMVSKIIFFLLTLIYYAAHYQEGNHVEEYSIVFLSAAAYCFMRALKDSEGKNFYHPPLYGFIYGLGFGACVLIRTSDAAQICCQTFLVTIFLLQGKSFDNLRKNFFMFIVGTAVITLPFVIYFATHGALYEMFYGTILFNMKYTALPLQKFPLSLLTTYVLIHFMPFILMGAAGLGEILSDGRNRLGWSGFFCATAILLMLMNFRLFRHYCMIFLPLAPLLFVLLGDFLPTVKNLFVREKNFLQKVLHVCFVFPITLIAVILIGSCYVAYIEPFEFYVHAEDVAEIQKQDLAGTLFLKPVKTRFIYDLSDRKDFATVEELASMIPVDERNSVVTWGHYCTAPHWVLRTGIKSRERLFFLNGTFGQIDSAFRAEWFNNIRNNPPLWIVYGVTYEKQDNGELKAVDTDGELDKLLTEKYSLKGMTYIFPQIMKLYRLRE
ncbi:MAG: hypothetical protein K6G55_06995 [Selenomonadaceae bacterium]|nr:hypothetical protein [Selenomonadaceae bacterium]